MNKKYKNYVKNKIKVIKNEIENKNCVSFVQRTTFIYFSNEFHLKIQKFPCFKLICFTDS